MTWVIVADSARARFFECRYEPPAGHQLDELDAMVSPESRLHEADITADRAGRTFDSRGSGRHAMEPSQSARDHQAEAFAKRLAEHVEDARIAGYFDKLVLVAPPKFLGRLRTSLSENALALVIHSIDKDLTTATSADIAGHLPQRI